MSKFQQLAFLLFVVAAFNYAQANETYRKLKDEIQGKFPGVTVTEIPDNDQKVIEEMVNKGQDIPSDVLDKYQLVMPYILDGIKITTFPARLVGGGGLEGKPSEAPTENDVAFAIAASFGVEEVCQQFIRNFADAVAPEIRKYAKAAGQDIESIEVGVESVGYRSLRQTYNVGFFIIKLQQ